MADDRKITIQIDESIKNSISPTQTLDELNILPNGSYYAKEAGYYAFGVAVEDNQMIIFNKKGSVWTVLSKVEFPSNEIDVDKELNPNSENPIANRAVAFIEDVFEKGTNINVTKQVGGINENNGSNTTSNNWIRSSFIEDLIEGDIIYILGTKTTSSIADNQRFYAYGENGWIGYSPANYEDGWLKYVVPAGVTRLRFIIDAGSNVGSNINNYNVVVMKNGKGLMIKPQYLPKTDSIGGEKTIFINVNSASAVENGQENTPFKSINKAIESVESSATFMISQGDYRETLPLANLQSGTYKFKTPKAHKVRILGSNKLGIFTKTSGYNNVYEIAYTGTILNASRFGRIIYEDGNSSRPILETERHPLQRSLSHRLPFTAITEKTSITDVDANLGTFYFDSANGKLYISSSNGTNPNDNGFSYEIAQRDLNTVPTATTNKNINIEMNNLQFRYSNNGLWFRGFESVRRENISVIGVVGAGSLRDDTSNVIAYNDEGAYCNGDGINGHFSAFGNYMALTDNRSMSPVNIYFDCWCHDNWDDGLSHHENHRVIIHGILTEYNDDGGVRASNDSNYTIYNGYARKNGLVTRSGEGFSVVNPTLNTSRNGCKMVIFNSISEGNAIGYAAISDSKNVIEIINCVSRNNEVYELRVRAGAKIISRNSYATNADQDKIKAIELGTIEVYNDTIIV